MDLRAWKIHKPSGVVGIEVRKNDMPHVLGSESARANLRERRFFWREARTAHGAEVPRQRASRWIAISRAKTCVHEHEPHARFDEQTMTDEVRLGIFGVGQKPARSNRTHGSAIQMMNAHVR